jgi:hypothetical protein
LGALQKNWERIAPTIGRPAMDAEYSSLGSELKTQWLFGGLRLNQTVLRRTGASHYHRRTPRQGGAPGNATISRAVALSRHVGGHAPSAARTVSPARMIVESLTPKHGIREQQTGCTRLENRRATSPLRMPSTPTIFVTLGPCHHPIPTLWLDAPFVLFSVRRINQLAPNLTATQAAGAP